MEQQMALFDGVFAAYSGGSTLSNADLYRKLSAEHGIDSCEWAKKSPIGKAAQLHSPLKRQVRWYQQTLKSLGLLEKDGSARGHWRLTAKGAKKLTPAAGSTVLLGFSTDLGLALWSRAESAFPLLGEPIHLILSSLPYPLAVPRDYGNPKESEYVDWVCRLLEPMMGQLAPGASIALNVGNDVFKQGSAARSMYKERMLLALSDRFGLELMDTLVWENPSRPPGPLQWASRTRQQLNAKWEPVYWLTNDPTKVKSNNRRVLQPHSQAHLELMARGGEQRQTNYGDGAHCVRPGSYGNATEGKIPGNVIHMGHRCPDKSDVAKLAKAAGLPVHGATMPTKLARFIIEFLTEKDDLVVDPCAGWFTTSRAAEQTGRRWFATEQMGEYVLGGALGFKDFSGFEAFGHSEQTT
jgi:DNA modification methylase